MLWVCCLIRPTTSSLNRQHLTEDRLANTAQIQHVFATHKFLIMKSFRTWKGNIEKNLSIEYGFPSGTRLIGILCIYLMIYLPECSPLPHTVTFSSMDHCSKNVVRVLKDGVLTKLLGNRVSQNM